MPKIEPSASQVENLEDFLEFNFIKSIRDDESIDNIEYLCDMCDIYKKLKAAERKESNDEL